MINSQQLQSGVADFSHQLEQFRRRNLVLRRGIGGDVVRVQDAGDHAFATCQQAATFMVGSALRMGLKREEHAVLNAN